MWSPSTKKKRSSWQLSEHSTPLERIQAQPQTPQNGAERQAPRGVTAAASMATTSRIALDQIDKGQGALPLGPSSNVFSARATTVRNCPSLFAAQLATERLGQARETKPQKQVAAPSARPSVPNEPSAMFKRDGTAILSESLPFDNQTLQADLPPRSVPTPQSESPVQVIDLALPAMSPESTPGTPLMQLFFILGAVQTLPAWILADSGSVRNLIDESVYNRLPFKPPIRDPGDVRVIGGNSEAFDLKGFAVLPVALGSNIIWHEFGVVPNLPLEVLVDADVLAPYLCSLLYLKNNKKRLQFGILVCPRCRQYRTDPEIGSQKQLRFIDRSLKHKHNRLKVGLNFLATLPEAVCDDSDNEQLKEVNEGQAPSVGQ